MRVERLGEGTPAVAVVAGVHGDEPAGVRAVESLLADPPAVQRPVKLVVANEAALAREIRYVDADLNRAFPGDADGATHEVRLAADLAAELSGCTTLSLHSTRSHAEPFAVVAGIDDVARALLPTLSIEAVVDTGPLVEGRLFATAPVLEVECGRQGSQEAIQNARRLVREFLAATDVLDEAVDRRSHPVFRLTRPLPKPPADEYEVHVENFQQVAAGEVFAAADGDLLEAEEPFYPVLLSADGYADIFGYAAERDGTVA